MFLPAPMVLHPGPWLDIHSHCELPNHLSRNTLRRPRNLKSSLNRIFGIGWMSPRVFREVISAECRKALVQRIRFAAQMYALTTIMAKTKQLCNSQHECEDQWPMTSTHLSCM